MCGSQCACVRARACRCSPDFSLTPRQSGPHARSGDKRRDIARSDPTAQTDPDTPVPTNDAQTPNATDPTKHPPCTAYFDVTPRRPGRTCRGAAVAELHVATHTQLSGCRILDARPVAAMRLAGARDGLIRHRAPPLKARTRTATTAATAAAAMTRRTFFAQALASGASPRPQRISWA
jgi:hypothetical protein